MKTIKIANQVFAKTNLLVNKIIDLSSDLASAVLALADSNNERLKSLANKIIEKHSLENINILSNRDFTNLLISISNGEINNLESLTGYRSFTISKSNIFTFQSDLLKNSKILSSLLNFICEISSDITNTIIFRNVTIDGRNLSIVNRHLPVEIHNAIKKHFAELNELMYLFFSVISRDSTLSSVGFVKNLSPAINAKLHSKIRPQAMINCDISKFFESTTYVNTIEGNLIFNSVVKSLIYSKFSSNKIPENFTNGREELINLFSVATYANSIFMHILPVLMHNGRIPTGAAYSPSLCNIIMRSFDIDMLSFVRTLKDKYPFVLFKYTRYADDITLSSSEDKDVNGEWILSIETVKAIELILNKYGYHLKYEKTKISGKSDKKEVTGVRIHNEATNAVYLSRHTEEEKNKVKTKICVSSDKKREIALLLAELSRNSQPVDSSTRGTLSWINDISPKQHAYCISYYLANNVNFAFENAPLSKRERATLNRVTTYFPAFKDFINLLSVNDRIMVLKKMFENSSVISIFFKWIIAQKVINSGTISLYDICVSNSNLKELRHEIIMPMLRNIVIENGNIEVLTHVDTSNFRITRHVEEVDLVVF